MKNWFFCLPLSHILGALPDLDFLAESDALEALDTLEALEALDGVDVLLRLAEEPPAPSEDRLAASYGLERPEGRGFSSATPATSSSGSVLVTESKFLIFDPLLGASGKSFLRTGLLLELGSGVVPVLAASLSAPGVGLSTRLVALPLDFWHNRQSALPFLLSTSKT